MQQPTVARTKYSPCGQGAQRPDKSRLLGFVSSISAAEPFRGLAVWKCHPAQIMRAFSPVSWFVSIEKKQRGGNRISVEKL